METQRIKCAQCDRMILADTAVRNQGLCGPCVKGDAFINVSGWQEKLTALSTSALKNDPEYLEDLKPKLAPYSDELLSKDSADAINYSHIDFVAEYRGHVSAEAFYPIGIRNVCSDEIEIIYRCSNGKIADLNFSLFPDKKVLLNAVKDAFSQYCSDDWCGKTMKEEVLEFLKDEFTYPPDEDQCFIKNGYYPYFSISTLTIDENKKYVIIEGTVGCDYNLDEHGVSILIQNGNVKFGYGADHEP